MGDDGFLPIVPSTTHLVRNPSRAARTWAARKAEAGRHLQELGFVIQVVHLDFFFLIDSDRYKHLIQAFCLLAPHAAKGCVAGPNFGQRNEVGYTQVYENTAGKYSIRTSILTLSENKQKGVSWRRKQKTRDRARSGGSRFGQHCPILILELSRNMFGEKIDPI
jgi:hypothetical protein